MTAPPDEAATPQVRAALRTALHDELLAIGRRAWADVLRAGEIREQLEGLRDDRLDG